VAGLAEGPAPVRDRVTVLTSVALVLLAAGAWVYVVRSSLRGDDMMMTMPMPATAADGLAFVASWAVMSTGTTRQLGRHVNWDDTSTGTTPRA
jgi:hypothetical protein